MSSLLILSRRKESNCCGGKRLKKEEEKKKEMESTNHKITTIKTTINRHCERVYESSGGGSGEIRERTEQKKKQCPSDDAKP